MKIIKNIDTVSRTWGGVSINSGASYSCNDQTEANYFLKDDNFIVALSTNKAEVYSDAILIVGVAASLDFLHGHLTDADGAMLIRSRAFSNSDGFRFRGASFKDTVTANTTKDIDFLISQERWINGGRALVDNIGADDQVTFQVVDKDNIFGFGAGVVLDQFISGYYVPQDGNLEIALAYPARLVAGLFLRFK